MAITRTTWKWDNWSGAPGYTNFYVQGPVAGTDLDAVVAAQRLVLAASLTSIPSGVTITCQATATQLNEETGALIAPVTIGAVPAVVTGTGAGTFAAPAGLVIVWRTTKLVLRRLSTGRTFIVPLASGSFDSIGTLNGTAQAAFAAAANTYVNRVTPPSDTRPVVWHRNQKFQADGFASAVVLATVNDRVSMLTSRRAR